MDNFPYFTWIKGDSEYYGDMRVKHARADYQFTDLSPVIGVDPGRNWGLSLILQTFRYPITYDLYVYWGTLPKEEVTHKYFDSVQKFINLWLPPNTDIKVVCVEGASYGERFGQVMLEDVRLGFVKAFENMGMKVTLVPPLTARKAVFGNGKIKASSIWLDINRNAADAAAIALYAAGFRKEKHGK